MGCDDPDVRRLSLLILAALIAALSASLLPVAAAGATMSETSAPTRTPVDPSTRHFLLLGDSLSWQAMPYARQVVAATGARFDWLAYPGASICDVVRPVDALAARERPDVSVVEFFGTAFSRCSQRLHPYSEAWFRLYAIDAAKIATTLLAARPSGAVYFVDGPVVPSLPARLQGYAHRVRQIYEQVATALDRRHPGQVAYLDAASAVEGPGGRYVQSLPCLSVERRRHLCQGRTVRRIHGIRYIEVRARIGGHFCAVIAPSGVIVPPGCTPYSSGAYRFGAAMMAPGIARERLSPRPIYRNQR